MVELEIDGGVPIEKEILPSQREYFPTFYEHLFLTAKPIHEYSIRTSGGITEIYTVPDNHYLYILALHLSGASGGVSAGTVTIELSQKEEIASLHFGPAVTSDSLSMSFNIPFKIEEKQVITLIQNPTILRSSASIIGFLVKKNVL